MRKKGLWKVAFAATLLVLLGFAVAVVPQHTGAAGTLSVHFIDVGQADSILIQTPAGKNILVDGGNNADGGLVVDYLRAHGVSNLAAVVATHPHEDHAGGLDTVIESPAGLLAA